MDTTGGDGSEPRGPDRAEGASADARRPGPDEEGPRPGDGPDGCPRPHPTWRDVAWAVLAGTIATVTGVQLVVLVGRLTQVEMSWGGTLLGFVIVVVWLSTIAWLVLGAWRRSVWGCPFRHAPDAPPAWRCVRHGVVVDGRHDQL